MDDAQLAFDLAMAAQKILADLRANTTLSGKALGDAGDQAANVYLMEVLRRERPQDGILCEEEIDSTARLLTRRVWVIDPLDGTREYSEGREDWAVHIGLSIDHVAQLGVVALGDGTALSSETPPIPPIANSPLKMLVSRTRPAKEALLVAEALKADLFAYGFGRSQGYGGCAR